MQEMDGKAKYTSKQKARLILALAYINTHRKEWKQEVWRCGTGMCLAGHIAITLNPSRPVAPLEDILKSDQIKRRGQLNGFEKLTEEEREFMHEVDVVTDCLIATKNDLDEEIEHRTYKGKTVATVPLRARAEALLGELASVRVRTSDDVRTLFSGDNNYTDLVKIAASALGIKTAELKHEITDVIKQQGWDKQKVNA